MTLDRVCSSPGAITSREEVTAALATVADEIEVQRDLLDYVQGLYRANHMEMGKHHEIVNRFRVRLAAGHISAQDFEMLVCQVLGEIARTSIEECQITEELEQIERRITELQAVDFRPHNR